MLVVYGIKNCDRVKKARKWLDQEGIDYRFHDLREDGIDEGEIGEWIDALGWEAVVNRRSTTWRQLDERERNDLDPAKAQALLARHPTLVKRPLFSRAGQFQCGFDDAVRGWILKY